MEKKKELDTTQQCGSGAWRRAFAELQKGKLADEKMARRR